MKIIISPAKKMEVCEDLFPVGGTPRFMGKTKLLYDILSAMAEPELKALLKANEKITRENFLRYQTMNFACARTPALLSYVGIQYQYMAPKLFSYDQWDYVKDHLRILSGFYGVLRPDDAVTPYRLEMQTKLSVCGKKDLYDFWGDSLYQSLRQEETDARKKETGARQGETGGPQEESGVRKEKTGTPQKVIVNLASREYSRAIEPYLSSDVRYVTCVFGVMQDGKVRTKATEAKMARGEMVRFMAEHNIEDAEELKAFSALGYRYEEALSSADCFTYIKEESMERRKRDVSKNRKK